MRIAVIDYGMGNLFSVEQALKRLGCKVAVTADIDALRQADALVLPGVGAFPDAMKRLDETGLLSYLQEVKETNKPLLGICLGMQLLFEESEEVAQTNGLGFFKGRIARFSGTSAKGESYRVPHMGWNNLQFKRYPVWLSKEALDNEYVYFVHSFYATDLEDADLVAYADYGGEIVPGIVQKGSITGMQFHPEKSGSCGVALLTAWLKGIEKGEA